MIFLTQISWGSIGLCGVLFVSQKEICFRTLEAIAPNHSFAKNHSSPAAYLLLMLVYCVVSLFKFTYCYKLVFFFTQLVDDESHRSHRLLPGSGIARAVAIVE